MIELAQFLAQPEATRTGVLDVKAIGSQWIKFQMEAQFDDEQGMLDEIVSELTGVDQAFVEANQERFEVGTLWMGRTPTRRALLLPLLDEGPIKEGEQRSIVNNDGIMGQKLRHCVICGMVDWSKTPDEGIIAANSFCEWNVVSDTLQKESFLCQTRRTFAWNWEDPLRNKLLATVILRVGNEQYYEQNRICSYELLASLESLIETTAL